MWAWDMWREARSDEWAESILRAKSFALTRCLGKLTKHQSKVVLRGDDQEENSRNCRINFARVIVTLAHLGCSVRSTH